jgi:hypothetical protein
MSTDGPGLGNGRGRHGRAWEPTRRDVRMTGPRRDIWGGSPSRGLSAPAVRIVNGDSLAIGKPLVAAPPVAPAGWASQLRTQLRTQAFVRQSMTL